MFLFALFLNEKGKNMEIKRFTNIKEFANEKTLNKTIYSNMSYKEKRKLKYYIYHSLKERNSQKDLIWEYLNEPIESDYFIYTSLVLNSIKRSGK